MLQNRMRRLILVLAAISIVAASCGDDSGDSDEATTESTAETTTTVPVEEELSTGDVQVTLTWPAGNADIVVLAPEGEVVGRATLGGADPIPSPTGGQIEGPDTGPCSEAGPLVTRTFWADGEAPSGDYSAQVAVFSGCDGPIDYTLDVEVLGEPAGSDSGSLSNGESSEPIKFEVP